MRKKCFLEGLFFLLIFFSFFGFFLKGASATSFLENQAITKVRMRVLPCPEENPPSKKCSPQKKNVLPFSIIFSPAENNFWEEKIRLFQKLFSLFF